MCVISLPIPLNVLYYHFNRRCVALLIPKIPASTSFNSSYSEGIGCRILIGQLEAADMSK